MLYLKSKNLGIYKHGFFLRLGGVSKSYYTSLNCGYSSNDNYKNITKNRIRILNKFSIDLEKLVVPNQYHSNIIKI